MVAKRPARCCQVARNNLVAAHPVGMRLPASFNQMECARIAKSLLITLQQFSRPGCSLVREERR